MLERTPDGLVVRAAAAADMPSIADIHASSWRVAYRGLFPDAFLDGPLIENRLAHWSGIPDRMTPSDRLLLAEQDGAPAGFIAGWSSERLGCESGFDLFIDNLHIRPHLRGRGIGLRLMRELTAERSRPRSGKTRAYLWLVDGNLPAYRFYARLGGRDADHREKRFGEAMVGELRIVWDDYRVVSG
jgi:ribosomal protein S18 acetylase RimI-like enzyme